MNRLTVIGALALAFFAASGHSHESHRSTHIDYSNVQETLFGRAADPRNAQRTVGIDMRDSMRFHPAELTVKRGETVRIVAMNSGKAMHEIVLGTSEEIRKHAQHMKLMPNMQHSAPNMAHVAPGANGEIGWQFTKAGDFQFACLLPGHLEAGMVGTIKVLP